MLFTGSWTEISSNRISVTPDGRQAFCIAHTCGRAWPRKTGAEKVEKQPSSEKLELLRNQIKGKRKHVLEHEQSFSGWEKENLLTLPLSRAAAKSSWSEERHEWRMSNAWSTRMLQRVSWSPCQGCPLTVTRWPVPKVRGQADFLATNPGRELLPSLEMSSKTQRALALH